MSLADVLVELLVKREIPAPHLTALRVIQEGAQGTADRLALILAQCLDEARDIVLKHAAMDKTWENLPQGVSPKGWLVDESPSPTTSHNLWSLWRVAARSVSRVFSVTKHTDNDAEASRVAGK